MCGVVGVILKTDLEERLGDAGIASFNVYDGLQGVQHRGQDGNGIMTFSNPQDDYYGVTGRKHGLGLVSQVHNEQSLSKMFGEVGLGHTRYPTVYKDGERKCTEKDLAPFFIHYLGKRLALAHNGQVNNFEQIQEELWKKRRIKIWSTCDSEVILGLYANFYTELVKKMSEKEAAFGAVKKTLDNLAGSTSSCMVVDKLGLLAFRDYNGITPLHLGEWKDDGEIMGYMIASETISFWPRFKPKKAIQRGEVVLINKDLEIESRIIEQREERYCSFQNSYFCRAPGLSPDGRTVNQIRKRLGVELGNYILQDINDMKEKPKIDLVTYMPETAKVAALEVYKVLSKFYNEMEFGFGVEKAKGMPLRNFIKAHEKLRAQGVAKGLVPMEDVIRNKSILVVDDSIVRGTTSRDQTKTFKEAGAHNVYWGITVPPIRYPCFWGIDFQSKGELIANEKTIEQIKEFLDADGLWYLPLDSYKEVMGPDNCCFHCLDGVAPTEMTIQNFSLD